LASLRDRAYGFLARREYSRTELARKLSAYADADEVDDLLAALVAEGALSDQRFAESLANSRSGRYGSRRLAQELREKGVEDAHGRDVLEVARERDVAGAHTVWLKKFGTTATDAKERARQYRFLLGRGFPPDVVAKVVQGKRSDFDEE